MATVLITGASGVLGRAVCDAYEARGDDVHRAFRSAEPGEQSHRLDVTDEPGHDDLCEREQRYLLKAIRENIDLTDHMNDAVKSLKIVMAADRSIHEGQVVRL